ncbi:hypothetical protein [Dysgonomonas sp. 511]|uniref:hypothetical protein n=1 Tax=Dysgonomonas sp. 511 TaxID=2302930 RepID=UPI0013D572F2|nr:hypothetical protein [Dysgonomonas sp. 511]NDV77882.1 hypothetical protein [Dysgonomonas sp. 511]
MKGICFIEPLHEKTVKGIKTQTRRIMLIDDCSKYHKNYGGADWKESPMDIIFQDEGAYCSLCGNGVTHKNNYNGIPPKYKVGEVLYLKEPYIDDSDMFFTVFPVHETLTFKGGTILYQYGNDTSILDSVYGDLVTWQNKLFMPASAARNFIKITGVRVEKLQDITEEDCIKEGIEVSKYDNRHYVNDVWRKSKLDGIWEKTRTLYDNPRAAYAALIDKINGKGTWESNPFVWVYDYELTDEI